MIQFTEYTKLCWTVVFPFWSNSFFNVISHNDAEMESGLIMSKACCRYFCLDILADCCSIKLLWVKTFALNRSVIAKTDEVPWMNTLSGIVQWAVSLVIKQPYTWHHTCLLDGKENKFNLHRTCDSAVILCLLLERHINANIFCNSCKTAWH